MTSIINPEGVGVWEFKGSFAKTVDNTDPTYIPPFDLGANFNSQFVAIGVIVNSSRSNWKYGGYLTKDFNFMSDGYQVSDKIFYRSQDLIINSVQIVEFSSYTTGNYRLRFHPANWFRDVAIQVWEYIGAVEDDCDSSSSQIELRLDQLSTNLEIITNAIATLSNLVSGLQLSQVGQSEPQAFGNFLPTAETEKIIQGRYLGYI